MNTLLFITIAGLELKDILIGLGILGGVVLLVKGMNTSPDMKNGNSNNSKSNNSNTSSNDTNTQ